MRNDPFCPLPKLFQGQRVMCTEGLRELRKHLGVRCSYRRNILADPLRNNPAHENEDVPIVVCEVTVAERVELAVEAVWGPLIEKPTFIPHDEAGFLQL
jgi:hypothetical protein